MKRRQIDWQDMPAKKDFWVEGYPEACEPTGFEILDEGLVYMEYIDHNGRLHLAAK